MCISLIIDCPCAKRSKTNLATHSIYIYVWPLSQRTDLQGTQKAIYYDTANKSWVEDIESIDAHADDCSSSELSCVDDINDMAVSLGQGEQKPKQ